jgi:hypothetical protein
MPIRDDPAKKVPPAPRAPRGAGMSDYLKEAFLFRWNLLFLLGGTAAAALTPLAPVLLPLVAAGELTYLTGLVSIPRFRAAIDAKVHAAGKAAGRARPHRHHRRFRSSRCSAACRPRRGRASSGCTRAASRCAASPPASAAQPAAENSSVEEIRTPGLDRLLWLFLRLLLSKTALDRFLQTMNEQEIAARLAELRKNVAAAQEAQSATAGGDDRILRSLQDSIAMSELRLDNYGRAKKNADFVSVELDRIEGKIQALAEMSVNRQDPDFLSNQVDSAAESMRQTEKAVSELQHLTGLADQLEEPPAILETDLRQVLRHDA